MTDVAPETVEAEAERMVRSFRGQPQNLDQLACNEVANLIDRLHSLLLRAEEIGRVAQQLLDEHNARPGLRHASLWIALCAALARVPESKES